MDAVDNAGFQTSVAALLARACSAAYLDDPEGARAALAAKAIAPFASDGTSGYVATVGDNVLVAFWGTVAGDLRNWLTNLDYLQVVCGPGLVHRGFSHALDGI